MKAYTVSDNNGEYGAIIVFADTPGKARQIAMHDDTFEECEWTELRVRRFKEYDQYYEGKETADFWMDEEHRVRLVRDFGWSCIEVFERYCEDCPAKQWCDHWREEK